LFVYQDMFYTLPGSPHLDISPSNIVYMLPLHCPKLNQACTELKNFGTMYLTLIGGVGVGSFHSWSWQISHIEFTRAQFSHHIIPGQAVKQFINASGLHFLKEL
jgi:hypothetical protein